MPGESSGGSQSIPENREFDEISIEKARDRRDELFELGFNEDKPTLIEALPAVGKSYGVVKWAAETGNSVSVFTERHELYDQYEKWATDNFDLTVQQLPVLHGDCPTVEEAVKHREDDHTPSEVPTIRPIRDKEKVEAGEKLLRIYDQGVSGRKLHERATSYFGEELPCQEGGHCSYMEKLEQDTEDVDLLIGNFRQVYADQYRKDRHLVFDEFPTDSFIEEFTATVASDTVSRFVSKTSKLPFRNWKNAKDYDHDPEKNQDFNGWLNDRGYDRDTKPLYRGNNSEIDARGPLLTEVAIRFRQLENGWVRADLGQGRIAVQSPNNEKISLLDPPPIADAKGVVALDGTPCLEKWELMFGEDLIHHSVFSTDQKREFISEVLELDIIRTSDTTKPYLSGVHVNPAKDMAFIEGVIDREDQEPSLISSNAAIEAYEERGIEELTDKIRHFNEFKGSDELGEDRLGIVIGSPHPNDDHVELWGALAGRSITRKLDKNGNETTGMDTDFGEFGNQILRDSREHEVLQAAMRFGRNPESGEGGATVYVHTWAIPYWVQPTVRIVQIHGIKKEDGIIKVINAIQDIEDWQNTEWKTSDITSKVDDLTPNQVRNILKGKLLDEGYIDVRQGGIGNAYHWSNKCLEEIGEYGLVRW